MLLVKTTTPASVMQKWMKWESDLGDLIAVPKDRESPGESAPSFSLLTLTPGKFEMNVSDRTELAQHLHKNPHCFQFH